MKSTALTRLASVRRWLSQRRLLIVVACLLPLAGVAVAASIYHPGMPRAFISAIGFANRQHEAGDGHDHSQPEANEAGHAGEGDADHDRSSHVDGKRAETAGASPELDHRCIETETITLSPQALANIGVQLTRVELRTFDRSIRLPGMVVERPGWSVIDVSAPMTGVVSRMYCVQGEAVQPGQPLFELRLTHEDLLQVQTEFLRTVEELDVIGREVARLEKVSADGVIAGKALLERKYEQQKQEAALRAQRQALLLHGLSKDQVDNIASTRTLLQSLTIRAPVREKAAQAHPLHVQELKVSQGKYVSAGDTLCKLADYGELYIEGQAFEQDIGVINKAASSGCGVSAILGSKSAGDEEVSPGLCILYLDDNVDPESRALHFYVALPNRILREDKADGRCFVYWQFRPGQRTQIRIPVEQWKDRIVLPLEAVAQEGAEAYVFEANDDHFDRRPVRIEYRDQDWVVIANDGVLKVGGMVAASAAHQMQLALKTRAGGGVDPHAGHNH